MLGVRPRAKASALVFIAAAFTAVLYAVHEPFKNRVGADVACCAATALSLPTAGCYATTGFLALVTAGVFTPTMGLCVAAQGVECAVGAALCDQTGAMLL